MSPKVARLGCDSSLILRDSSGTCSSRSHQSSAARWVRLDELADGCLPDDAAISKAVRKAVRHALGDAEECTMNDRT